LWDFIPSTGILQFIDLYVNYSSYVSKYKNRLGGTQVMRAPLLFALSGAIFLLGPGANAVTAGKIGKPLSIALPLAR
jgi:hypothetical protein